MNLFGCKFCETMKGSSDVECDRKNFDSLLWAIVTVFQVPTKDTFPRISRGLFFLYIYIVYITYITIILYIYIYIYLFVYILTLYTCQVTSIYVHYIYMWVYVCVCMYAHIYMYIYIDPLIYIHIYVKYIYIYIYIHTIFFITFVVKRPKDVVIRPLRLWLSRRSIIR